MKWINKGHEFDCDAQFCKDRGILSKTVYVFGAGVLGEAFLHYSKKFINIGGFLDNDIEKQGTLYCNLPVISLVDYMKGKLYKGSIIVLCLKKEYCQEVTSQLINNSFVKDESFMVQDEFEKRLRISLFYERNIIYLPLAQISLTERCTLRCKKCAHACNLVSSDTDDFSFEEVKRSADYFFKHVDYVLEFVLLGGEPFLYRKLADATAYIGEHYRDKIGVFSITTNGTIIPNDELIKQCRKYDVIIRISNYSDTIPTLQKKHKLLKEIFDKSGIKYILPTNGGHWMDYGFDWVDRHGSSQELEKVFNMCNTPCHEIRGSKFYFCVMARSVAENMKNNKVGMDDYLDLNNLSIVNKDDRTVCFEYMMGYSEKGYLDMCNYCNGAESRLYPVPVAEQMKL